MFFNLILWIQGPYATQVNKLPTTEIKQIDFKNILSCKNLKQFLSFRLEALKTDKNLLLPQ